MENRRNILGNLGRYRLIWSRGLDGDCAWRCFVEACWYSNLLNDVCIFVELVEGVKIEDELRIQSWEWPVPVVQRVVSELEFGLVRERAHLFSDVVVEYNNIYVITSFYSE